MSTSPKSLFSLFNEYLFFTMLFFPILGYFYTAYLRLPKDINTVFVFIFFIYGLFFLFIKKSIVIPNFAYFILIFAIYRLSWNLNILPDRDMNALTRIYHYLRDITLFLTLVMIYNTTFSDQLIRRTLFIFKITLILAAIISVVQVFNFTFLNPDKFIDYSYVNEYTYRRKSIFGFVSPSSIGYDFLPMLSILISFLLTFKRKGYFYYLIIGGIVAFLTNNRYIMIDYLFLYILIFVYKKQKISSIAIVLVVSFIVFYYGLQYIGYNFEEWYNKRLLAEGEVKYTTRYLAIGNFIRFFPENPFLGTGEQTSEIYYASRLVGSSHIHVGYLSHLVNYGIIGCFFLFGSWFLILHRLYKTAKLTNFWGSFFAFSCFLIGFATHSDSSLFYYGLIFSFIFDKYYRDRIFQEAKTVNS